MSRSVFLSVSKTAQRYQDKQVRPALEKGQLTAKELELQAQIDELAELYQEIAQTECKKHKLQEQVLKERFQAQGGSQARDFFVTSGKDQANLKRCIANAVESSLKTFLSDPDSRDVVMAFDATYIISKTTEAGNDNISADRRNSRSKSARTKATKPDTAGYRNIYVFMLTPINPKFKAFPINVHFCNTSQFNEEIVFIYNSLYEQLTAAGVRVVAVCHDAAQTQVGAFATNYFEYIKDKVYANKQKEPLIDLIDEYRKKAPICLIDPLHIIKRIRTALLDKPRVLSGQSEVIDKSCILTADILAKVQGSPKDTFSQNKSLKMADKPAMVLLDPTNVDAMDLTTRPHQVVVNIPASCLFAPFIKGDSTDVVKLLEVSRKCLAEHYKAEEIYAARVLRVNEKNEGGQPLSKLFSPELLRDMICYVTSALYIILKYRHVRGFALTSNPVEVYFGHIKDLSKSNKNSAQLQTVAREYIAQRLLYIDRSDSTALDNNRSLFEHVFLIPDNINLRSLPRMVSPYVKLYCTFINPARCQTPNEIDPKPEYLAETQAPFLEILKKLEL